MKRYIFFNGKLIKITVSPYERYESFIERIKFMQFNNSEIESFKHVNKIIYGCTY